MKVLKSVDDYNKAIEKLTMLMDLNIMSSENKKEPTILLDVIDSYNGMEFLKVREGK